MLHVDAWVRSLVAILLLAGIAELLLPSGAMKGYARALLGLLVLLGMLQPLVGLLHGDLRVDLPVFSALGAGVGAGQADTSSAAAAALSAYEQLVAGQAARIAEQVPGVQSASATISFTSGADGSPAVQRAAVEVQPSAAGLAQGDGLRQKVRQAVAGGLGLSVDTVEVQTW